MRPYAPVVDDDPAFEARAKATYLAVLRPGRDYVLPLRWVDVIGHIDGRDLLAEVRAARANLNRDMSAPAAAQAAAVRVWLTPVARERHNKLARARYNRKKEKGRLQAIEWKAERERIKAAQRTPKQQKRHEEYLAQKARRSGS